MLGNWGKLLRVNLTTREIEEESIPTHLFSSFIGGSGLATKYLYDEVPAKTDPFSSENKVIFATGPFQSSPVPGGAKWSVVSRSPLTETFGVTGAGASFGVRLKRSGYDLLIIEGQSQEPVYLYINDGDVSLRPADSLWGEDAIETVGLIKEELEEDGISVATIGIAGEKRVGIACITADTHSFAGRCGFGAVLGAKNLKAVAVKGTQKLSPANESHQKDLFKRLFERLRENARDSFNAHGTAGLLTSCEEVGDLPIKYWTQATWPEGAKEIGAPNFTEKLKAKSWPCMYCPVGCHRRVEFDYREEHIKGAGAEYESLGMLGSNCLVDDLSVISKANDLCNRLGLDTISAGSYVGFTMECFEKGLVTEKDLNGSKAIWGDGEFLLELIGQIGHREGFGALFAKGIRPAAEEIGGGAKDLTVEVKNLDFPAHDPRTYFSLAINYATSTRGACHLRGYPHAYEMGAMTLPEVGLDREASLFTMEGKAEVCALFQDIAALHDSLVICMFIPMLGLTLTDTAHLFEAITGSTMTPKELMEAGRRIVTLQRQMNVEDGLTGKDDRLPGKMFQPAEDGFREGKVPEPFEETLASFYELRGYDSEGCPTRETLESLDLI